MSDGNILEFSILDTTLNIDIEKRIPQFSFGPTRIFPKTFCSVSQFS
jgi:hypothetical protein